MGNSFSFSPSFRSSSHRHHHLDGTIGLAARDRQTGHKRRLFHGGQREGGREGEARPNRSIARYLALEGSLIRTDSQVRVLSPLFSIHTMDCDSWIEKRTTAGGRPTGRASQPENKH